MGSGVDTVAKAPSINHVVTLEQKVIKIELEGYLRTVLHIGSKYLICNIFRIAVMYILIFREHLAGLIVHDPCLSRSKTVYPVHKTLELLAVELSRHPLFPAQYFKGVPP